MAKGLDYIINLVNGNFSGVDKAKSELDDVDNKIKSTSSNWGNAFKVAGTAIAVAGLGLIANGIGGVADELIQVRGQFQGFENLLTNQLGPAGIGVFQDIKKFAAETPFEVDQLTESFIKLQGSGFNPTIDKMGVLGDLAASKMKSIDQLSEAVIDAQTGEFERLKEFGIRASKAGDDVTFTYNGMAKTMKMTQGNVEDYIVSLGKVPGVTGAMAAMSDTFIGKQSNVNDKMTQYKDKLGKDLEPVLSKYLELKSTAIDKLQLFTDKLIAIPQWLRENETGLKAVGVVLGIAGSAALLYGGYQLALAAPLAITNALTWLQVSAQWALNAAMTANPIGLIVAGVALLGGGLYYAYQKSETLRAGLNGLMEMGKALTPVFMGLGKILIGAFTLNPAMVKSGFEQAGKAIGDIQKKGLGNIFNEGFDKSIKESKAAEKAKANEDKQKQAVAPMTGNAIVPSATSKTTSATTGGGGKKGGGINESVAGGNSVKHITITIQSLIKDFHQNVNNLKGTDAYELKRIISETLMGAVRDVEIMAE